MNFLRRVGHDRIHEQLLKLETKRRTSKMRVCEISRVSHTFDATAPRTHLIGKLLGVALLLAARADAVSAAPVQLAITKQDSISALLLPVRDLDQLLHQRRAPAASAALASCARAVARTPLTGIFVSQDAASLRGVTWI